jgi:hypothetical protein
MSLNLDLATIDEPIGGQEYSLVSCRFPQPVNVKKHVNFCLQKFYSHWLSKKIALEGFDSAEFWSAYSKYYSPMVDTTEKTDENPIHKDVVAYRAKNKRPPFEVAFKTRGGFETPEMAKKYVENKIFKVDRNYHPFLVRTGKAVPIHCDASSMISTQDYSDERLSDIIGNKKKNVEDQEKYLSERQDILNRMQLCYQEKLMKEKEKEKATQQEVEASPKEVSWMSDTSS